MGQFSEQQRVSVAKRMVRLAEEYLADEDILSRKVASSGSGATMLGLIGLEIYLKAAVLIETGHRPSTHDFFAIWKGLPEPVRQELLREAKDRYPGHTDFSNLEGVFHSLKKAFKDGRYSYEINDNRSDAEASDIGKRWINDGGASETAELSFYPMERSALVEALRKYWKAQHTIV